MILVTADQMREMDRQTIEEFGIPGRVLMEIAGRGATDTLCWCVSDIESQDVAVICGKGNNGGDGYVMARLLYDRDVPVTVYVLGRTADISGDAAGNLELLPKMGVPVVEVPDVETFHGLQNDMRPHTVWVDAILGTGLSSEVRGFYREVIEFINFQCGFIFSVDMPSGLFSDTGQAGACVQANATATFGFGKIGQFVYPGAGLVGHLEVVDIGIPRHVVEEVKPTHFLITRDWACGHLPRRPADAHKGHAGHLLVVAGSPGKTGAAAMAANSAMRVGAGLVTLAAPQSLNPVLESMMMEVMTTGLAETPGGALDTDAARNALEMLEDKRCLAIGPGIGTAPETVDCATRLVARSPVPVVVDADGLNCLARHISALKEARSAVILTPHPGEMARLCGVEIPEIQADRAGWARKLAMDTGAHCVLKGARTVVAHPDGTVWINITGNAGMASGGMGDILTGIIAGFLSQGLRPKQAARMGVFLHGMAADLAAKEVGPVGFLAGDLLERLPRCLADLAGFTEPGPSHEPEL